jgi:hypothetical protein
MAELINLKITYRLLQQNRPEADVRVVLANVGFQGAKETSNIRAAMSAHDLGCVKTPARYECAELLSQLSFPDRVGQRFCF